jgi:hypothetical protein
MEIKWLKDGTSSAECSATRSSGVSVASNLLFTKFQGKKEEPSLFLKDSKAFDKTCL